MKKFLIQNVVISLIAVGVTVIFQLFILKSLQNWLYLAIALFFGLNFLVFWFFNRNNAKSISFVNNVMISSMLRLFGSLGFFICYLLLTSYIDKASVIFFLFYYLLFFAFEIYYLVYKLRPQNQSNAEN